MTQSNWLLDSATPLTISSGVFVGIVSVYHFTSLFTAEEAVAFGTLFLALITAVTVHNTRKQTEYMRKESEFMRRPRLSIHHESKEDSEGLLVFENTGQVPVEATLRLSLAPVAETNSDDPILNDEVQYEDLPDEIKVYDGGAGDWRNKTEFLEPGQKQKYIMGMLGHEIVHRDDEHELKHYHWFRVDGELTSELYEGDRRKLQRLYHFSIDDSDVLFSSVSFSEARNR